MYKFGPVQKKILVALLGGVALGLSSSPRQYYSRLSKIGKEWKKIDQSNLKRSIGRLAMEKLLEEKHFSDGSFKLVLTEQGKRQAKMLDLLGGSISFKNKKKWDGKWRIVAFDIPEKDRIFRDILRRHLREMKFYKLQNSVFLAPFSVEKVILELSRLYQAEKYVRVITAVSIDNERFLKNHFFGKNIKSS